ncbi:hypothetical protein FNV43_RR19550 [Rhamnella rubrinervis]|uniref:Methyltransferase type 11 domain-containing protein n=1 Tax=Rhamnella rubrinervis TaxID=2594499 RepID=A0A8K0GPL6_9ROSA|nr:hypothetical protein FNV43_RR19550 [Rhamnella rubrinervis]
MKTTVPNLPLPLKPFLLSLFLFLTFLTFLSYQTPLHRKITLQATTLQSQLSNTSDDLRIRPGYSSYESYIQHQLNKTLNPKLRKIWTTRDWDRKVRVFAIFFQSLKQRNLIFDSSKALCVGARVGQEVSALRSIGVSDSVGLDLVPHPPLVVEGDFHAQPFDNETFDFEFSNVFDHALYPWKFVGEIERTLKPEGVRPLVQMFKDSEVVDVRKVDGFGLDTEVVFQKKMKKKKTN